MSTQELDLFVAYLCLVYHEARNVRHLVKERFRERGPYQYLQTLPTKREAAWAAVQDLRRRASRTGSATAASEMFADRFRLALEELVDLYEDTHWRNYPLGGNQWSGITRSVIELRDALDQGDAERVSDLLSRIPAMTHNTGQVGEKLRRLDAALE